MIIQRFMIEIVTENGVGIPEVGMGGREIEAAMNRVQMKIRDGHFLGVSVVLTNCKGPDYGGTILPDL